MGSEEPPLDAERVRAAWRALLEQHEKLREKLREERERRELLELREERERTEHAVAVMPQAPVGSPDGELTHDDLCLHGLGWATSQSWTRLAAHEVALDVPRWWYLERLRPGRRVRARGRADVIAVGQDRIAIIEVKRTRADLLSDLRSGKMIDCYGWATHCYLLLGPAVADTSRDELTELGLPRSWGVLRVRHERTVDPRFGRESDGVRSTRSARRQRDVRDGELEKLGQAIGRSLSWRVLRMHAQAPRDPDPDVEDPHG